MVARSLFKERLELRALAAKRGCFQPESLIDRGQQCAIEANRFREMAWDIGQRAKRK